MASKLANGLFVYCKSLANRQLEDHYDFLVFVALGSQTQFLRLQMDEYISNFENEHFSILEMANVLRNERSLFDFLIYSQVKVLLVTFDAEADSLKVINFVYQNVEKGLRIEYSERQQLFLVPNEEYLELWNPTFSFKVHSIQLKQKVKGFRLIPTDNVVVLYDKQK